MYALTSSEIRNLEAFACEQSAISLYELMERAGKAVYELALSLAKSAGLAEFVIIAGKGNNAGDAFVCARLLHKQGCKVSICMTHSPDSLKGDAKKAFLSLPDTLKENIAFILTAEHLQKNALFIDGILGIGAQGYPREPAATWIEMLNAAANPVLSIDLPSGMNADSDNCELAVIADHCISFLTAKKSLLSQSAAEFCGRITVADLNISHELLEEFTSEDEAFGLRDAQKLLKREHFCTYKNLRGHVAIVGGSRYYAGAPILSAEASLRSGSGLCTVFFPKSAELYSSISKALIVRRIEDSGKGFFNLSSISEIEEQLKEASVIAFGPGLSCNSEMLPFMEMLFALNKAMVLDADALNLLCLAPEMINLRKSKELILTPHSGEMRRLLKAFKIPSNLPRKEQALRLAKRCNATVILKGCRTVVASSEQRCSINLSGCPALACAGSGDVLTGICASFVGQKMPAFEAATLAVYIHGLAGEILAPIGSRGIIADDIIKTIPKTIRTIKANA